MLLEVKEQSMCLIIKHAAYNMEEIYSCSTWIVMEPGKRYHTHLPTQRSRSLPVGP